jgi:hypothetical protein
MDAQTVVIDEDNVDLLTDHEDIVQELRDFSYIIKESTGVAVVTMLEGTIFDEAADEIERLRTALGLACGLLSTYYAMSPPDKLTQQFLEEARRG